MNTDKLRRLLSDGDDALEVVRARAAQVREAKEHCAMTSANVYRRAVLLEIPLEDFLHWPADDLAKAHVNASEVRAALEAQADLADLLTRLTAARAAADPKIRLAARLRDFARPEGKFA